MLFVKWNIIGLTRAERRKAMMKILMSVHPERVAKILFGEKKFEYRRIAAKQDVDSPIIYETTPVNRVVGKNTRSL